MTPHRTFCSLPTAQRQAAIALALSLASVLPIATCEAAATQQPKTKVPAAALPKQIANDMGMEFVLISPGRFLMGQEGGWPKQHWVQITKPFYLSKFEVTRAQWEQVMNETPGRFQDPECPVTMVSWDDCVAFCDALSKGEGVTYRLPTSAEWEYACRAGSTTKYCFGDDEARLGEYAWYGGNSGDEVAPNGRAVRGSAHPVGLKKPNAWGLFDMHGNVAEFCSDRYDKVMGRKTRFEDIEVDPKGHPQGEYRIFRGGCWLFRAELSQSSRWSFHRPGARSPIIGLRVVREVVESPVPAAADQAPPRQADAAKKPKTKAPAAALPKEVANDTGMEFVLIRPGRFLMGPEGDQSQQHWVQITKPFYLSKFEVTVAQWEQVMNEVPGRFQDPECPVAMVSWEDCVAFCDALSKREGATYRLPTSAEWEYACRAGSTTKYCFGDDEARLGEYAWYGGNSGDEVDPQGGAVHGAAHPVGLKKPNAWGLFDMHGNVAEFCSDRYDKGRRLYFPRPEVDPKGHPQGEYRIFRGGSWFFPAKVSRSSRWSFYRPGARGRSIGFRPVREVGGKR